MEKPGDFGTKAISKKQVKHKSTAPTIAVKRTPVGLLRVCSGQVLGLSWASLGLSWAFMGSVLGSLGLSWACPGMVLSFLGFVLGPPWVLLGLSWPCLGPSKNSPALGPGRVRSVAFKS